jgi:L-threonylcarbamoyladenylate synthase
MLLSGRDPEALREAARHLAAGELVGLPTETVYGLAARADDDAAVARIFAAKGRPSDHPLIVHVTGPAAAEPFADHLPEAARRLMGAFWPGPLTVIVPRRPGVAEAAAGGADTIALRCPAHPVAHALLEAALAVGVPGVAAPSANRFGRVSPTLARHVVEEFGPDLLVLDGGACEVGIESSIVDCSGAQPVLLRPGLIPQTRIETVLGRPLAPKGERAVRAPGTLAAHYAPQARVRLLDGAELSARLATAVGAGATEGLAVYSRLAPAPVPGLIVRPMPRDAAQAAFELFATLREFDTLGAREIWIETPPADPAWDGVRDRLSRAAATFTD